MIVRELLTRLGFEADDKNAKKYDDALKKVRNTALAVTGAAVAMSAALFKVASNTAKAGDEIAKTARQFGVGARELQQFRFAMDRLGISEGEATAGLDRLTRAMGRARQGSKKEADAFARLGVQINNADGSARGLTEVLPDIANAMQGVTNEADRAAMAQDLFGGSGGRMAAALAAGGEELDALMKRFDALGGGMSEEGTANAEAFTDAMADMRVAMAGLSFMIGEALMPAITDLVNGVLDWYVANQDIIRQNLSFWVDTVVGALRAFWNVVRAVLGVVESAVHAIGGWENALRLLTIVIGGFLGLKLAAWFTSASGAIAAAGGMAIFLRRMLMRLPFVALATAVALLVDDLWSWVNGSDSMIGRLLGPWEDFKATWQAIFASVKTAVSDAMDAVGAAFQSAWAFIEPVVNALKWVLGQGPKALEVLRSGATAETTGGSGSRRGARENGGFVNRGSNYMVGERGPEPFFASRSGYIASHKALQGMLGMAREVSDMMSGAGYMPQMAVAGGGVRNTVNANVTVQAPSGTTEAQAAALQAQVQPIFNRLLSDELGRFARNYPRAE